MQAFTEQEPDAMATDDDAVTLSRTLRPWEVDPAWVADVGPVGYWSLVG